MSEQLLTYDDIAKRVHRSMRHVRERLMKDPQAPAPVLRGVYKESDINRFLNVLQCRRLRDCNRPSRDAGLAIRTSGKDQERQSSEQAG
jgi:hypothetical protein